MSEWITKPQTDLEAAIAEFKAALPGWYYSVCECQVSCDATCAPTTESPDIALAEYGNKFDSGFTADLCQPATLADALRDVMEQALEAKRGLSAHDTAERYDLARDELYKLARGIG